MEKTTSKIILIVIAGFFLASIAFILPYQHYFSKNLYSIDKIHIKNTKKTTLVTDLNYSLEYALPTDWKIIKPSSGNNVFNIIFSSREEDKALRFLSGTINPSESLRNMLSTYLQQKTEVRSMDRIKIISTSIKPISKEECSLFGVEQGYVSHIELPEENMQRWRQEYIILLKKNGKFFLFSFVTKDTFYPMSKTKKSESERFKEFAVQSNPIYMVSGSLKCNE